MNAVHPRNYEKVNDPSCLAPHLHPRRRRCKGKREPRQREFGSLGECSPTAIRSLPIQLAVVNGQAKSPAGRRNVMRYRVIGSSTQDEPTLR